MARRVLALVIFALFAASQLEGYLFLPKDKANICKAIDETDAEEENEKAKDSVVHFFHFSPQNIDSESFQINQYFLDLQSKSLLSPTIYIFCPPPEA